MKGLQPNTVMALEHMREEDIWSAHWGTFCHSIDAWYNEFSVNTLFHLLSQNRLTLLENVSALCFSLAHSRSFSLLYTHTFSCWPRVWALSICDGVFGLVSVFSGYVSLLNTSWSIWAFYWALCAYGLNTHLSHALLWKRQLLGPFWNQSNHLSLGIAIRREDWIQYFITGCWWLK